LLCEVSLLAFQHTRHRAYRPTRTFFEVAAWPMIHASAVCYQVLSTMTKWQTVGGDKIHVVPRFFKVGVDAFRGPMGWLYLCCRPNHDL